MASSLEDVGKSPGGDSIVSFLRVTHNDDGTLKVVPTGSGTYAIRSMSASGSATTSDNVILADATAADVTVTLPPAASLAGQQLVVRKTDSTTHAVTVTPNGSETINGVTGSITLKSIYTDVSMVSDGVGWHRLNAPAVSAKNATYYVDGTSGNDSNQGRAPWDAFLTIGAAITAAGSKSTIWIAAGTYVETIDLSNKQYVTLRGMAGQGTIVQAPSSTTSALKASTGPGPYYISNIQFQGASGAGATYTGTVCDMANFSIGSKMENCTVMGVNTDFTGSKTTIGAGTNGGIGMSFSSAEQVSYDNIEVSNCNIGLYFPGGVTLSKLFLSNFHLGQCFIVHKEVVAASSGDNTFSNFKTQNVFGLAYAIAQLQSPSNLNPADGDTVTVRDQTYRFKNTMALANDVKIGASVDATLLSLVHAVNGTGTPGTDYFAGTAQPTGVRAGWMNLVDYGSGGGNGYTNDAVDTTHHACTFQVQDVVGPSGNAYTFTVTSTNLIDYFGKGSFARAAWAIEITNAGQWLGVDAMENISLPIGNAILIGSNGSIFDNFVTAPQTQTSVTGNNNHFRMPKFQNSVTVQSGATNNVFDYPSNNTGVTYTSPSKISDSGTGTIIRMGGRSARNPTALTYSASMTPNAYTSDDVIITATNGTAFTINAPVTGSSAVTSGQTLAFTIRNTSGGALGVATWNAAYKMAAWTQPANGNSRTITFRYDGTNWIEISRTPSDVPN